MYTQSVCISPQQRDAIDDHGQIYVLGKSFMAVWRLFCSEVKHHGPAGVIELSIGPGNSFFFF